MTDENRLIQERSEGARAQAVLDNDLVKRAFDKIEATITEAWKSSPAEDERGRYNAYLMHRLFQNFKSEFTRAVATGKVAEKRLLEIKDKSKLRRTLNV